MCSSFAKMLCIRFIRRFWHIIFIWIAAKNNQFVGTAAILISLQNSVYAYKDFVYYRILLTNFSDTLTSM